MDQEEQLVAELRSLGIRYITRKSEQSLKSTRPPQQLLADLVCQSNSRVRMTIIPLLIIHPEYVEYLPAALEPLSEDERFRLKLLYSAAVILQQIYSKEIESHLGPIEDHLPDLFTSELGIPANLSLQQKLDLLATVQQKHSGQKLNWVGTYEKSINNWLRQKKLEKQWNQYPVEL